MPSTTPYSLLYLPRELRNYIYGYLFDLPVTNASGRIFKDPLLLDVALHIPRDSLGLPATDLAIPYSMLAPLCKTSKQLYWEATPYHLTSCILLLEDTSTTKYLITWLDTFGKEGFRAIKHLEFVDFTSPEDGVDHLLLLRCPNLRSLNITFRGTNTIQSPFLPTRIRGSTDRISSWTMLGEHKSMLVYEAWRVEVVLELGYLERIAFGFPDEKNVHTRRTMCLTLRDRLRNEWEAKAKWVEIDCGFDDW